MQEQSKILNELQEIKKLLQLTQPVLSLSQFCTFADISMDYAYKLTSSGKLKVYKPFGKKIYIDREEAIDLLKQNAIQSSVYEHIAETLLTESGMHEMIFLPQLKRAMAGWKDEKMYNIGMKSRKTKGNDEAYKQLLGPLVQKGVLPSDKFAYTRGHSFGGAFDTVLDKDVLLGISTSSKVWSLDEKKNHVSDWMV